MCATNSADMQHPLFFCAWKNSVRHITSVLTLCVGFWAAFVFPRVNLPVRAVSSFLLGVLPAFWPQRGIYRGIDRWQCAFSSRLVHISRFQLCKIRWFSPLSWLLHSLPFFSDAERCSTAFLAHGCIFMGGNGFVKIHWSSPCNFVSEATIEGYRPLCCARHRFLQIPSVKTTVFLSVRCFPAPLLGNQPLTACNTLHLFSQTQSDVLRRFLFRGVIWQPKAD